MLSLPPNERKAFMTQLVRENMEDFMPTDQMAGIRVGKLGYADKHAAFEELIDVYTDGVTLTRELKEEKEAYASLDTDFHFLDKALGDESAIGHFANIQLLRDRYVGYWQGSINDTDLPSSDEAATPQRDFG